MLELVVFHCQKANALTKEAMWVLKVVMARANSVVLSSLIQDYSVNSLPPQHITVAIVRLRERTPHQEDEPVPEDVGEGLTSKHQTASIPINPSLVSKVMYPMSGEGIHDTVIPEAQLPTHVNALGTKSEYRHPHCSMMAMIYMVGSNHICKAHLLVALVCQCCDHWVWSADTLHMHMVQKHAELAHFTSEIIGELKDELQGISTWLQYTPLLVW